MDRDAMVRAVRRRQALEAIEYERGREAALAEQLEERVAELEGARIDEAAFARLEPEEVALIRKVVLGEEDEEEVEEDFLRFEEAEPEESEAEWLEGEIARLQEEIAGSKRRQRVFERYLEALDSTATGEG